MLSIIVAKAKNNVIGKDNQLIWHIKDDLNRFKRLTTGHNIIMGRRTFESLGRVLPNRFHIVLCNDKEMNVNDENVKVISDISNLKEYIDSDEENFVIGGATIYKLLLPMCSKLYITQLDKDFDGDVYFPEINEQDWNVIEKEEGKKDENPFKYEYVTYVRK